MTDINCLKTHPRSVFRLAAIPAASALLLCTFPAAAGLSGTIGTGGAGHSLKDLPP